MRTPPQDSISGSRRTGRGSKAPCGYPDRGFTLIELLIIIVILGVLASIVVAAVFNATTRTTVAACQSDYKTVELAQEAYRGQMGTSATSFSDLMTTHIGLNGHTVGPWLKDSPSTASYVIGFYPSGSQSGDITVATSGHAAALGNENCSYA